MSDSFTKSKSIKEGVSETAEEDQGSDKAGKEEEQEEEEYVTVALSLGEHLSTLSSLSSSVTSANVTESCVELFLENGLLFTRGKVVSTSSSTSYTTTEDTSGTADGNAIVTTDNDAGTNIFERNSSHESICSDNGNIANDHSRSHGDPIETNCEDVELNLCGGIRQQCKEFFFGNLFSDELTHVGRLQIFRSTEVVRLFKFFVLTFYLLGFMYIFTRILGFEHDASYNIQQFFKKDMGDIITDSVTFFVIGRLHERRGVDRLFPFILPMTSISIITSWSITSIWWMKTSITWYNVKNEWSWQLIVFASLFISIVMIVIFLHVKFSIYDDTLFHRSIEGVFIVMIFLVPHIFDNRLHLHHWYLSWLFGMLCNREEWWSELSIALSWGLYINGVSAYGRDGIYERE